MSVESYLTKQYKNYEVLSLEAIMFEIAPVDREKGSVRKELKKYAGVKSIGKDLFIPTSVAISFIVYMLERI